MEHFFEQIVEHKALTAGEGVHEAGAVLMASQAKRKNYDFPYLIDESQNVAKSFGATNTPHVFVLQKSDDKFEVAYIGTIDNNSRDASAATKKYVEEAVDALLAGKTLRVLAHHYQTAFVRGTVAYPYYLGNK